MDNQRKIVPSTSQKDPRIQHGIGTFKHTLSLAHRQDGGGGRTLHRIIHDFFRLLRCILRLNTKWRNRLRFSSANPNYFFSISLCLALFLSIVLTICVSGQTTPRIPFTPDGIRSIIGKNLCDFQGEEWEHTYGVYLDHAKRHLVDYRERDGVVGVFLLSKPTLVFGSNKPTLTCGVVDASLDLTRVIRKNETFAFKCYTAHEGGTTWGKWGHVIGIADNESGTKRFVKARLAWRVDVKGKSFQVLKGESVACDTSGYAN